MDTSLMLLIVEADAEEPLATLQPDVTLWWRIHRTTLLPSWIIATAVVRADTLLEEMWW